LFGRAAARLAIAFLAVVYLKPLIDIVSVPGCSEESLPATTSDSATLENRETRFTPGYRLCVLTTREDAAIGEF
jgi:hypothetical protein